MPHIRAIIQDEKGNPVGGAVDFSEGLFPYHDDERFPYLRFVDPYGDTVFNRLQMPAVLEEMHLLRKARTEEEDRIVIDKLIELACLCQQEPHLYLKFIGD